MTLRSLDDRYVPGWARAVRGGLGRAQSARARLSDAANRRTAPSPPGRLGRLDDRLAARGPLAVLRRSPQVGLALAVSVLATATATALAHTDRQPTAPPPGAAPNASSLLGPPIGVSVADYVRDARQRAVRLSAQTPDGQYVALVSLSGYLTPEQVRSLMGPLRVERALLRAPHTGPTAEVVPVPVADLVPDLRRTYAALAVRKAAEQREFRKLSQSIAAATRDEATFKAFYAKAAVAAGRQAAAFRAGCACVFGVLVSGPARVLAQLTALHGVRVVELAALGVPATTIQVRPLLPEVTGVVRPGRTDTPVLTGG